MLISCLCRTTIPGAVDVVFCSDQSADSWIVKEAEIIRREGKTPHVGLYPQTISCCVSPPVCVEWKYKCCHEDCLDIRHTCSSLSTPSGKAQLSKSQMLCMLTLLLPSYYVCQNAIQHISGFAAIYCIAYACMQVCTLRA